MSATKNIPPVRYDKFDIKKFSIEKPQGKEYSNANQILSFLRYENVQFNLQTPMLTIVSGGVPSPTSPYHKTDEARMKGIKIPLDVDNPEVKILHEVFKQIDDYLVSDEFKSTLPDSKKYKYEYLPLIRKPINESDGNKKYYDSIKVKLDCKLNDDKINIDSINTSVFQKNESGKLEKLPISSIDDFAKHVCYLGTARFVLSFNKFYILRASKKYGITLKIKQVEVNPVKTNAKFNYDEPTFDDDDEDNDVKSKLADNSTSSVHIKVNSKPTDSDEDEDEDDLDKKEIDNDNDEDEDDEDDDEEPEEIKTKAKSKSKTLEQESEKQPKKGRKKIVA